MTSWDHSSSSYSTIQNSDLGKHQIPDDVHHFFKNDRPTNPPSRSMTNRSNKSVQSGEQTKRGRPRYIVLGASPYSVWQQGDPMGPQWDRSRLPSPRKVQPRVNPEGTVRCLVCERAQMYQHYAPLPDVSQVPYDYTAKPLFSKDRALDSTLGCLCMPVEAGAILSSNVTNTALNLFGLLKNTIEGVFRSANRTAEHGLLRAERTAYHYCRKLDDHMDRRIPPPMVESPNAVQGCAVHGMASLVHDPRYYY